MAGERIFKKKAAILVKLEDDYGVDATPLAANAIRAHNLSATPLDADEIKREPVQPYMGAGDVFLAALKSRLSFETELTGSGTAGTAPAFADCLLACGLAETTVAGADTIASNATAVGTPTGAFTYTKGDSFTGLDDRLVTLTCTTAGGTGTAAFTVSAPAVEGYAEAYSQTSVVMTDSIAFALPESATIVPTIGTSFAEGDVFTIKLYAPRVTYSPISEDFDSASIYLHQDKVLSKLLGGRGTFTINFAAKAIPAVKFDFMGLYTDLTAEDLPEVDFSSFKDPEPPSPRNTSKMLFANYLAMVEKVEFDAGQMVEFRSLVNYEGVLITDRESKGKITIEEPEIGDKNFWEMVETGTIANLIIRHGTAKGKIIEISGTNIRLSKMDRTDSQGIMMLDIPMTFKPTNAGNDEFSITFK